jgi:hypothetical protein
MMLHDEHPSYCSGLYKLWNLERPDNLCGSSALLASFRLVWLYCQDITAHTISTYIPRIFHCNDRLHFASWHSVNGAVPKASTSFRNRDYPVARLKFRMIQEVQFPWR